MGGGWFSLLDDNFTTFIYEKNRGSVYRDWPVWGVSNEVQRQEIQPVARRTARGVSYPGQ